MQFLKDFVQGEDGATAIEYALVGSLISMGIVAGASQIGIDLGNVFNAVAAAFP